MKMKKFAQLRSAYRLLVAAGQTAMAADLLIDIGNLFAVEYVAKQPRRVVKPKVKYPTHIYVAGMEVISPNREEVEIANRPYDNRAGFPLAGKLDAVKTYKNRTGHSLMDSKRAIEYAMEQGWYK